MLITKLIKKKGVGGYPCQCTVTGFSSFQQFAAVGFPSPPTFPLMLYLSTNRQVLFSHLIHLDLDPERLLFKFQGPINL